MARRGLFIPIAVLLTLVAPACVPGDADPIASLNSRVRATVMPRPHGLPATPLIDQYGERFDLRAAGRGKVTFLFFGYTYCPDICPITLSTLARALTQLEPDERSDVLGVFISLDPARDTPERIGEWLAGLDPAFVGLTGSYEELDEAMGELGYVRPPLEIPAEGFYEVPHPAMLFMFTPDRLGRFGYSPDDVRPEVLVADIRQVLATEWKARAGVRVSEARVSDPLGQDRASVYARLENVGKLADTLLRIESQAAGSGSLHRMSMVESMMRMELVPTVVLPAGGTVELAPGSLHGMLEGLGTGFGAGDTLEVTFVFSAAGPVTVMLPVVAPADVR